MAQVYLALDRQKNRNVAIKIMMSDYGNDSKSLHRFARETLFIQGLENPYILEVYAGVIVESASKPPLIPYIVMEYAEGGSLKDRLQKDQPYLPGKMLCIFDQVSSAVQCAHDHGIIHRDLKPANILFVRLPNQPEKAVLSDFGIAVEVDATHQSLLGTPAYMAPEIVQGRAEYASDIFSLGVILYQLCTGKLPFKRSLQNLFQPLEAPPRPSTINPALPIALDDVILTVLSEDPSKRFKSVTEFAERVRKATAPPPNRPSQEYAPSISNGDSSRIVTQPLAYSGGISKLPSSVMVPTPSPEPAGAATLASHQQVAEDAMDDADELPPILMTPALSSVPAKVNGGESPNEKKEGLLPIDLPVSRPKITAGPLTAAESVQNATLTKNAAKRTSSKITAIGPVAAAPAGGNVASRPISNVPPPKRGPSGIGTGGGGHRPPRNVLIALGLVLLVLLLALCSVAYAAPGALGPLREVASALPHVQSAATVTVMPVNQRVSTGYIIEAVTSTPNPAQHQVSARLLSQTTPSQQRTVLATGQGTIPAVQAAGTLTFKNGAFVSQTVGVGAVFTGGDGVQVVNDFAAIIPADNPNTGNLGRVTVAAHAIAAGSGGNIGAGDISGTCCALNGSIFVTNSAFTGGQNEQHFPAVSQSDIDNAAKPLAASLVTQAQQGLNGQVHSGEKLLASPQCTPSVTADHQAGDRASNVTMTVSAKCNGEVYDQQGMQSLLQNLLQQKADSTFGPGYARAGDIVVTQTKVQNITNGNVSLLVQAQGVYQMSDALQLQLKKQIAGKSVTEARTLLKSERGIGDVTIQSNGPTLPTDPAQIAIVVQNVAGLPGAANGSPTVEAGGTATAQPDLGGS
jgi:serine/threonine protein kinase